MTRPLRIEFNNAWYHVMNRGLAQRNIVKTDNDRHIFFKILGETVTTYGIEVHAFSLMNNHYHLLIHTPEIGLSRAMRHLNGVFTQKINKAWKTDGPIFRGRYKAIIISDDDYLIELVRYIHLNPVVAGIYNKANEHRWSSHRCYLNKKCKPPWLTTKEILSRFDDTNAKATLQLNRYVHEGVPTWFSEDLKKNRVVLGKEGFRDWIYNNYVDKKKKDVPLKDKQLKTKVPVKKILEMVGTAYDLPISTIRNIQHGQKNEARSVAIYLVRYLSHITQREMAKWFRMNNQFTIAKNLERFKKELHHNKKLRIQIGDLKKLILSHVKL